MTSTQASVTSCRSVRTASANCASASDRTAVATAIRASRLPPRSSGTSTRRATSGGPPLLVSSNPVPSKSRWSALTLATGFGRNRAETICASAIVRLLRAASNERLCWTASSIAAAIVSGCADAGEAHTPTARTYANTRDMTAFVGWVGDRCELRNGLDEGRGAWSAGTERGTAADNGVERGGGSRSGGGGRVRVAADDGNRFALNRFAVERLGAIPR